MSHELVAAIECASEYVFNKKTKIKNIVYGSVTSAEIIQKTNKKKTIILCDKNEASFLLGHITTDAEDVSKFSSISLKIFSHA